MGLLRKLTGGEDKKLLQTGLLGRGVILGVQPGTTTLQMGNGLVGRVCTFSVQVTLDGKRPYEASCRQRIPEIQIPQFQPGATVVAVRVDPENDANIALDLGTAPPEVTLARDSNAPSAKDILANGAPGRAVIIENQKLGMKNPDGIDMYAFTLTVMPEGKDPYQIQVGNPTPPAALPFLFPGSHVPVRIGSDPNAVVIDWAQASVESKA